jgi:ring-1,2-phenylacetyl-CoA epoxidase subunit PaaB
MGARCRFGARQQTSTQTGTKEFEGGRMSADQTTPAKQADANNDVTSSASPAALKEWPLWEVFVRSKQGLEHKHCGSLHASDSQHALQMARDVYTRRQEGVSVWVVQSSSIAASEPNDKSEFFEPSSDKVYRHPTFYEIPSEVGHM